MGITNEQYERLIRFMDARMESSEMDAFEKELDTNPAMRHQLNFEQSIRNEFSLLNIKVLHGEGAEPGTTKVQAAGGKLTGIQKWLALSAAVITAVMLFTVFWKKPAEVPAIADVRAADSMQQAEVVSPKNDQPQVLLNDPAKDSVELVDLAALFKKYFTKDVLPEHYPLYLAEAFMDYESGNYKTLQNLDLNNLPSTRSSDETYSNESVLQLGRYYKALAFLHLGNTRDAIPNFNWVLNNQPGKTLKLKAHWYLALTYLKQNQKQKAAELFRTITSGKQNDTLVKSAAQILDTLGK